MPQSFNINPPIVGMGETVRSVNCFFYASEAKGAEVPMDQAHYVEFEGFTQNNLHGTSLGWGRFGSPAGATVTEYYKQVGGTPQQLLEAVYG